MHCPCSDTLNFVFHWPGMSESCTINLLPFSGQFLLAPGSRGHSGCHSGSCQQGVASREDEVALCRKSRAKLLLASEESEGQRGCAECLPPL